MSVAVVVLAAGRSSRLGRPKQLLDLGGEPLLRHTLRNALAAGADDVVLVLGNAAGEIAAAVGELGQRTVVNVRFAEGQSTSLHSGIAALGDGVEAAVLMLGDQPTVGPEIVAALIARWRESGAAVVQPVYGGVPANPVLIARALFPELLAVGGDEGARSVIRAHREEIALVPVSDGPPPQDVDTEEDYAALVAAWGLRG
jgi:molybdenum cofactor cytidylyltransferase